VAMQPGGGGPYPPAGYPLPGYPFGWGPAPPPVPRPRGAPTRIPFTIGGIGHFFAAGMAIPLALFGLAFGFGFFFFFGSGFATTLFIIVTSTVSAALLIHLVGFYGLWRNYGSQLALATVIFGLVAIATFLSTSALVATRFGGVGPASAFLIAILVVVSDILLGVMFILEGCTYIVNRYFLLPGGSIAAGVLFTIAGGFLCSIILGFIGAILSMPALIIGGILLVKAPIPVPYPPPRYAQETAPPTGPPLPP